MDARLAVALLRFRASAARCGEAVDGLTDAELLEGLGEIVADDAIDAAALLAAGIERVGHDWPYLLDQGRSRFIAGSRPFIGGWSLRNWMPWRAAKPPR